MHKTQTKLLRKSAIATAIAASIGSVVMPGNAISDIYTWGNLGSLDPSLTFSDPPTNSILTCDTAPATTEAAAIMFTMLDPNGGGFANTSKPPKISNQFQTSTCGTLTYDTETQSGSMVIVGFDFFNGSAPAAARGITIEKVPAGLDDGSGNLILANMLFDWHVNFGIPVSISYDASGLLEEMDGSPLTFTLNPDGSINTAFALSGTGAAPASDGTYVGLLPDTDAGYLLLGPSPLATTEFNTSNTAACLSGDCDEVNPSADINASSAIVDTNPNPNEFLRGDGVGVAGNPMQSGPFFENNANFDFTSMTLFSFTDTTAPTLALNAHVTPAGTSPISLTLNADTYTEPGATCTDAAPVNANLNANVVVGGDTVDTAIGGIYTVTYNCDDDFTPRNAANQITRTVVVASPGAPLIALNGNDPETIECATPTYVDASAICVDFEDGPIPVGPNFILDQSAVDAGLGLIDQYTATWTCTDLDTNPTALDRTVNVTDTINPVVALQGNAIDDIVSSTPENIATVPTTYPDPMADSTDTCDPTFPINNFIATSGNVNMVVPDDGGEILTYILSYLATDASGNTDIKSRTVNVQRSQPVITLVGGGVTLNVGDTYTEEGMNITDAQQGDLADITASGNSSNLTYTIDSSTVDTSTTGDYAVTYDVRDNDGNLGTQVTRTVSVGVFATGSNFTMLDAQGNVFGGTNDVVFDWDQSENTSEADLNFNMTIASQLPFEFFSFVWTAHDIRVFGPGTYSFDSGCTIAEIQATGCPAGSAANSGPAISMTVPADHVGAHILFDWNTTDNIDVVNVWEKGGVWDQHGDTDPKNKLYDGLAGDTPDPTTTWKLISTDVNGDDVNGAPMVDGPFQDFYANFNAGPGGTVPPPPPYTGTAPDTELGSSLLASLNVWGLFAGLLTLLGLRRLSKKQ